MPKMKTHRATAKRFRITRTGKVLHRQNQVEHSNDFTPFQGSPRIPSWTAQLRRRTDVFPARRRNGVESSSRRHSVPPGWKSAWIASMRSRPMK